MGSCPDTDTDPYIHYIYINNLVFSTELIMFIGKADISSISPLFIEESKKQSPKSVQFLIRQF